MATTRAPFIIKTGLDNGGNPIVNVADPVNPQDAATLNFASNASNLTSGVISPTILSNSTLYIGTTAIALTRASAPLVLTGITSIDGVSAAASKLVTPRSITATGDANWTVSFDGSAGVTGSLTLANTGVTAGTYNQVTVDAKGRVTVGANVSSGGTGGSTTYSDVVAALGFVPAASGANTDITSLTGITLNTDGSGSITVTGNVTANAFYVAGSGTPLGGGTGSGSFTLGSTLINDGDTVTTVAGLTSVSSTGFTGALTGNASSATKLAASQSISMTGDGSWSVNFDGSGGVTNAMTLATINSAPVTGSFQKITTNAKGLVTATTNVVPLDITTALGFVPAASGTNNDITSLTALTSIVTSLLTLNGTGATFTVPITAPSFAVAGGSGSSGLPTSLTIGSTTISLGNTATSLAGLTSVSSTSFVGALTGNADTATKLSTARFISATGDATWTASFDGSGNATGALTLTSSGVTPGTYTSVTVDSKGRVTAGSSGSSSVVVNANLTATGTTQGTGLALTGDINVVAASTVSAYAVVLPTAVAGKKITVINTSANAISVFPAPGAQIDSLPQNNAISIPAGMRLSFDATSGVTWSSSETAVISGGNLLPGTVATAALQNSSLTIGSTSVALGSTAATLTGLTSVAATTFTGALTGDVTGNASTATAWATPITLSITGDATGSASVDGSGNAGIALTLANSGVTAGTYGTATGTIPVVTVDSKGRVTAIANTALTSLPSGVSTSGLIKSSSVTVTAAGTDQSTATALAADLNIITTSSAGTGVLLPNAAAGVAVTVYNTTTNTVVVYPNTGATIDTNSANVGVNLVSNGRAVFDGVSATGWRSSVSTNGGGGSSLVISTATPLVDSTSGSAGSTGQVSDAGHSHPFPTAGQLNVIGLPLPWDPVANLTSDNQTLHSGTAPTGDNCYYATSSTTLSTALDSITAVSNNDIIVFNGTAWILIAAGSTGTSGSTILKGNGVGGITNAVVGQDYTGPIACQTGVPLVTAPAGIVGANGALTILGPSIFYTSNLWEYYTTGAWMYFPAGAVYVGSPAGLYWTVMCNNVMGGTISAAGTGYTDGTYTNVPLTGGAGSGAQATIVVVSGAVAAVVVTTTGTGYAVSNVLSASNTNLGGAGSGFTYTVGIINAYATSGFDHAGTLAGGSGYVNGSYTNVPLTGGAGTGATANITVVGGAVVSYYITNQGYGYGSGNNLSCPNSLLGGTGSGFTLQAGSLGGPMTGTVYNNVYVPGNNTGAWSVSNQSFAPPASPVAFTGTQGSAYSALKTNTKIVMAAYPVAGNALGNNGAVFYRYIMQGMSSTFTKTTYVATGTVATAVGTLGNISNGATLTNSGRLETGGSWTNRGRPDVQVGQPTSVTGSSIVNSGVNTANPFYIQLIAQVNAGIGTCVPNGGTLAGGSGYTDGTYYGVPLMGGAGSGAVANITISGGAVTSVSVITAGTGYASGNALTASTSIIGAGSGFTYTMTTTCVSDWMAYESFQINLVPNFA